MKKQPQDFVIIGLRTATSAEIKSLMIEYQTKGYQVTHVTENLPHNGVLRCVKP